jgi:glutamate N-acetyltransferase/amino-acid N-acetyltransferase
VSFSRITVDGDTSTNDTFALMANGMAGNEAVSGIGAAYDEFVTALTELCQEVARQMAADGEGAHHLMSCTVTGAADEATAEVLAKSVVASTLTKAAIYGCDANWGRVLCALGYSGASFDPARVTMSFTSAAGEIEVCRDGVGLAFDEDKAKKILEEPEVGISVSVGDGVGEATCWGCDITHEYISINGDYRS